MANGYFVVQNGLQVGPLTIDASTGSITTAGDVSITGNLGVSQISKNDSSVTINDTGSGSSIAFNVDGVTEHTMTGSLATINSNVTIVGNVIVSNVGYVQIPAGTTAQRPGAPALGMIRYNSTISSYEGFGAGSAWSSLGGVKSVDGFSTITAEAFAGAADNVLRFYSGSTGSSVQVAWASASNISILPTTQTTSKTTGALQVTGGVGINNGLWVGGAVNFDSNLAVPNFSSGNITGTASTLAATNFSTANARITGTGSYFGTGASLVDSVYGTTGRFTNFSSANISGVTNSSLTTLVATNFSTANAQITGGTVTGLTNLTATTTQATNFSTANAQITGTGSYFGTGASLVNSVYGTTGYFTNFSSANIDAITNLDSTTSVATNFSTGNIVATGGSINNVTVGATTATTGRFTTVTATTVNAGTIGNTGATLTGTISTTTQNSITTMAGLVSLGSNNIDTVAQGNFTVTGNLTVQGVNQAIGSQNLTVADSIIELHTFANLAPLTFDDGRDIGLRFHYYKGADKNAVLIWENTTEQLHFYANALEVSSNISGQLGTVGVGELFAGNSTVSNSTGTGALRVTGGAGIGGAAYIGGVLNVASTSTFSGATNHAAGITASTVSAGTIGNTSATLTGTLSTASQPNITTLGGVTSVGASGTTTITGILQTAAQTNVTSLGTLTGLTVSGAIIPNANLTINVGSASAWFNTFFGVSTQAKYADLAENYQADKTYPPGTVLMFGGSHEVTVADVETTAVAGVVSTNPAHLMNGQLSGPNVTALALQGRVPCNVVGPIKKGDMLVSAGFGYARASATPVIGQVIGKALADYPSLSKGQIEVVVGRM